MAEANEEIVEGAEPENEVEKVEPEDEKKEDVPLRSKPWTTRQERAEFFKNKNAKESKEKTDDDEIELTPKVQKLIEEQVGKHIAPLQDELAFRDYFSSHPEDKKFEKQARARYDAWSGVPIEEVMKTLRPDSSKEDKDKAEDKVNRGSMKGGTNRPTEEKVATTKAELEAIYKGIKRGEPGQAAKLGIK